MTCVAPANPSSIQTAARTQTVTPLTSMAMAASGMTGTPKTAAGMTQKNSVPSTCAARVWVPPVPRIFTLRAAKTRPVAPLTSGATAAHGTIGSR